VLIDIYILKHLMGNYSVSLALSNTFIVSKGDRVGNWYLNKRILMLVVVLLLFIILPPAVVRADITWGITDQLLDDLTGCRCKYPAIAIAGSKAVAAWRQGDWGRICSRYSIDGGVTWKQQWIISQDDDAQRDNVSIAMSGSNVVAVWWELATDYSYWGFCSNYSTDGGASWNTPVFVCTNSLTSMVPSVAISGSNAVMTFADGGNKRCYSNNGGATWNGVGLIGTGSGANSSIAMSGSNVVLIWEDNVGGISRICRNYSSDSGVTWHEDRTIDLEGGLEGIEPKVAISGSNVVAVWMESDGVYYNIYTNYSEDWGVTWKQAMLIEENFYDAWDPCIAIDGSRVVAAWSQSDSDDYWDRVYALYSNCSSNGGLTWNGAQEVAYDGTNDYVTPQAAVSGSNAVLVWYLEGWFGGRIHATNSTDGGVTWLGDRLIEDNVDCDGFDPQVAISRNHAVFVWWQGDSSDYFGDFSIYSNYITLGEDTVRGVGGEVERIDRLSLLLPWAVFAAAVIALGSLLVFFRAKRVR
jgi:hypothetical protein